MMVSFKPDPDIVQNDMLFPYVPYVEPEGVGRVVDPGRDVDRGADFGPFSPAGFKAVERNGTIIYLSDGLMFKNTNHQSTGTVAHKRIHHAACLDFFDRLVEEPVHGMGVNTAKFIDRV